MNLPAIEPTPVATADMSPYDDDDDADNAQTNRQMTATIPTQLEPAVLAANNDKIENTTTPVLLLATMNLPAPEHTPVPTTDRPPYDDDEDGDGNHHPSSITDTFNLQTKMLRNLKTMVADLTVIVVLIVNATTRPNNSYISEKIAHLFPDTTLTTIRPETVSTVTNHPANTQIKPWPPHHVASSYKLAYRLHKKHIPAKPPFTCGRPTCHLAKTRKDSLRPP